MLAICMIFSPQLIVDGFDEITSKKECDKCLQNEEFV